MKQLKLDGSIVPVGPHRDDTVVCSDGTEVVRSEVFVDCAGGAHSSDEDRKDANVAIVTELLDAQEKWYSAYCTENEDFASGYDCIVAEGSHGWKDRIEEYLEEENIDYDAALVAFLIDRLDANDCELKYNRSDYSCYSGPGLCLDSIEIGEQELQIDINNFPELKVLHESGELDDILDCYNGDLYISRSQRRVLNEETGCYEQVGRDTYMPYGDSDYPNMFGYANPGGQWHWVVPADTVNELIREYRLENTKVTVSADVLRREGYTEIVEQDGNQVTLRNEDDGLEVFGVRESIAGWGIPTDQGLVLEFCRTIS